VALIGLRDLTRTGEQIALRTMMPFTVLGIVLVLYYVISAPLARLAQKLEKRVGFTY
jgi:ABC-type amino acid transport system permease subunit